MHACWEVTCFDVNFRKFGKAMWLDGCRISSKIAASRFPFLVKQEVDFRSGLVVTVFVAWISGTINKTRIDKGLYL